MDAFEVLGDPTRRSEAKLVTCRREGRRQIYRFESGELEPVVEWIARRTEFFWKNRLEAWSAAVKTSPGEPEAPVEPM